MTEWLTPERTAPVEARAHRADISSQHNSVQVCARLLEGLLDRLLAWLHAGQHLLRARAHWEDMRFTAFQAVSGSVTAAMTPCSTASATHSAPFCLACRATKFQASGRRVPGLHQATESTQ